MTLSELTTEYLAGPAKLRAAVAGLTREQLTARPVAGKWSCLELVAHIADFEAILADRMKRTIAANRPLLLAADENGFASALAYHDRDISEELALIEATRVQMARILRSLPDGARSRVGVHSEAGLRTLEQTLTGAANHIPHHLPFLYEKRRALGLGEGGADQSAQPVAS